MYECKEILPRRKNFEASSFNSKGQFMRRAYVGATVDDDYIVFYDDNLRALGVTEGYIDFFYKQYLYYSRLLEEVKRVLEICPDNKSYKNDLIRFEGEKNFYKWQISDMHECSVKRVKCPEEEWRMPIYWWMGFREYVRDVPELQKFKQYPGLCYADGKSYLYYFDKEKYDKFCEESPKFEEKICRKI